MANDDPKPANDPSPPISGARAKRPSLWSEFFQYLMENKKWWMIPIIVMVLLLGLVLVFAASPVAALLYPFF
jgi:hypothetical protein